MIWKAVIDVLAGLSIVEGIIDMQELRKEKTKINADDLEII